MNYQIEQPMDLMQKLAILADAAKYDVACTSSGVDRSNDGTGIGNCLKAGICHTFAGDGRCISPMNASTIANTASTGEATMCRGQLLHRKRSAR